MSRRENRAGADQGSLASPGFMKNPLGAPISMADGQKEITLAGELFRKLTHMGAISIPLGYIIVGRNNILFLLGIGFLFSLTIDLVRIFGHEKGKQLVHRLVGIMIRPRESRNLTGASYILGSSILTIILFDKAIAILAIAFIVVGDTAGALVGRMWGQIPLSNRKRTLEGSLSFFFACGLIALMVPQLPFWVKVIGAGVATVVEAFTVVVDDNLTVPLISGAVMQLIVSQLVNL